MKHLSEDELIEVYYNEGTRAANAHLSACRKCSAQYARFKESLDAIRPVPVPQRSADYGERVWELLRPQLIPYEKKRTNWLGWTQWRAAAIAVACAVLLAVVFLGGRYWERSTTKKADVAASAPATQRVVVVVLTDHLDRTEQLLVQLKHIDLRDRTENAALQSQARELLASNRLYRTTASNAGDPVLAGALDQLERVLAEIANNPNLTTADLERVRKEMNTEGILFEIRVLLTRSSDQKGGPEPAKGALI
jgi:hypothetical protein